MRALIACAYSCVVRDAFIARGHDAVSCDLLPADGPGPHYQGDVFDIIGDGWDIMIAFVEPWMFGHPETKATGLWLKNLPPLVATDDARTIMADLPISERNRIHYTPPSADRWKIRSTTYAGMAEAFAAQWGDVSEAVA